MQDNERDATTSKNKQNPLLRLSDLYRRYDGPPPKDAIVHISCGDNAETEKWLRFWRGQVLHAVYALRRQRAVRYQQRTRSQFFQWRGGIIIRRKTLTSALKTYRRIQKQKNRPPDAGRSS